MLDARLSRSIQFAIAVCAIWALLFQHDLFNTLWVLAVVPYLGALGLACLLVLDAIIAKLRKRPAMHVWTALALALSIGPLLPILRLPFCWISAAHVLLRHESEYAELVRRAKSGETVTGISRTKDGPTPLYAFWWGGTPNFCFGVVHDGSRTFDRAPYDVLAGIMTLEMHLWGPWYYAEFR